MPKCEALSEELQRYDRIIIHRHSNPDGDAMGSQIGLKHILRDHFPNKEIYAAGDAPKCFAFMEDSVMDVIPDSSYESCCGLIAKFAPESGLKLSPLSARSIRAWSPIRDATATIPRLQHLPHRLGADEDPLRYL